MQSRFYRESVTEASTTRPVPGERAGCVHALAAGNRYLFNFHPAAHTHAQKTDSARKRAKRKTAVAGGGLQRRRFRMFRDCCREGYLQSGRIKDAGKFTVFFLAGHGPRPGWTAVAGGGPGEVSELVTWFGEFS